MEGKIHMKPMWNDRMKLSSNGPGHMTKMAAMPIHEKKTKKKKKKKKKKQQKKNKKKKQQQQKKKTKKKKKKKKKKNASSPEPLNGLLWK